MLRDPNNACGIPYPGLKRIPVFVYQAISEENARFQLQYITPGEFNPPGCKNNMDMMVLAVRGRTVGGNGKDYCSR